MKGANWHKLTKTRLSFTVIILLIAIFIICAWERNPLITSFGLSSDQFKSIPKDFANLQESVPGSKLPSKVPDDTSEAPDIDPNEWTNESEDDEVRENDPEECNYAKGKWVPDARRPFYSGSECKRWLSEMWACRLMQRPDFSFEKFRWQPQNCQMPSFTGPRFLKRMQHKTLAFVGDSLGRQQFQSMMCMITGGKPAPQVQDVGWEFGLVKARGAVRPDGWAYRFPRTNTTVLFYWSASLCELQPLLNGSDPKPVSYALHLDRPVTFLKKYLDRFHVLVLNTGHHWNRGKFQGNHWELHAYGKPVGDSKLSDLSNAKNLTLHSIVSWLNSQIVKNPNLKVFLRTLSPRHFVNGDWNTGGSCDNTVPLRGGSEVSLEKSSDPVVQQAVNGSLVRLLDITALSQLRDECHISKYSKSSNGVHDCLHWCLPGVPDTWNEILFARI
ncbi:protein trichome birefringence-like 14 isoform X3 [Carex littledalei]|uniref:Protein trichome birefringence-like 14 isoform X3 n=1 Tax=Carex littledalei TaxID=544730 RepID=A0A833QIH7_9POAL|nr:protein trichome birefringence-like 14 isoform X3 [Carex littledalei]